MVSIKCLDCFLENHCYLSLYSCGQEFPCGKNIFQVQFQKHSIWTSPATTIRAPINTGDNLGLDRHHLGSYLPVIPRHMPAYFDKTIRPLLNYVEKRSSKELSGQAKPGGLRVGIGSLPGNEDEEGVALGPEEKCRSSESPSLLSSRRCWWLMKVAETTSVSHSPAHGGLGSTLSCTFLHSYHYSINKIS